MFEFVQAGKPRAGAFVCVVTAVTVLAAGALRIEKDTSIDAFVPESSAALELRNRVESTFGLKEPVVIALVGQEPGRALQPDAVASLRAHTELLKAAPGVEADRVMSLVTHPWLSDEDSQLIVKRVVTEDAGRLDSPKDVEHALTLATAADGTLVSSDRSSVLIVAELSQGADAPTVYKQIRDASSALSVPAGLERHIAGQATLAGFLNEYLDQDINRLVPLAIVIIIGLMTVLLRDLAAAGVGIFIMLCTVLSTVGLMGWVGAPMYVITGSLPPLLLCISVADTIHLLAAARRHESISQDGKPAAVQKALEDQLTPISLTSITTVIGFLGITFGHEMPPFVQYGLFAAFGVFMAWMVTLFAAPAVYLWLSRKPVPVTGAVSPHSFWRRFAKAPGTSLALIIAVTAVGIWGATLVNYNDELVENFSADSEIYRANQAINERFSGTYYLDVVLQVSEPQSLFSPIVLNAVTELQRGMEEIPLIQDSYSYVDTIRDTQRATNASIPESNSVELMDALSPEAAEQLLFLVEMGGRPGDTGALITPDREYAHVRGFLRTDNFQQTKPVMEQVGRKLAELNAIPGLQAELTGPLHLAQSWIGPLLPSTVTGLMLAVLVVWITSTALFRNPIDGAICMLPVGVSLTLVIGMMGISGIWFAPANTMFAAISVGLTVDFAIHLQHALRQTRRTAMDAHERAIQALEKVGKPLSINALALSAGFSSILFSTMPPVRNFGLLMLTACVVAFISSLLILPAIEQLRGRSTVAHVQTA